MATKEEAKAKLRKAGYSIVDDNAVITVLVSEGSNLKNTVKNVKELLIKIDYKASFGIRQTNSSLDEENIELSSDADLMDEDDADILEESTKAVKKSKKDSLKESAKAKDIKASKKDKASDDDFFDDEDEDLDSAASSLDLDALDMDMLLNEESVQFSLDDFGLM